MFLKLLKGEKEKEAFLELAHLLIPMDERFTEEEKKMLDEFKWELNYSGKFSPYKIEKLEELDNILRILMNNSKRLLMGLLIELIALAKVNGIYSVEERRFLKYVADFWGIKDKLEDLECWVDKYFALLKELEELLSREE